MSPERFLGGPLVLLGWLLVAPGRILGAAWVLLAHISFLGTLRTTLFVFDVSQQARGLRLVVEGYFPITMASYSSLLSDHLFPHLLRSDYLFVFFSLHLHPAGEEMIRVFTS